MDIQTKLHQFKQHIAKANSDKRSERVVRYVIEGAAHNCPLELAIQLGHCIAEYRQRELDRQNESN